MPEIWVLTRMHTATQTVESMLNAAGVTFRRTHCYDKSECVHAGITRSTYIITTDRPDGEIVSSWLARYGALEWRDPVKGIRCYEDQRLTWHEHVKDRADLILRTTEPLDDQLRAAGFDVPERGFEWVNTRTNTTNSPMLN